MAQYIYLTSASPKTITSATAETGIDISASTYGFSHVPNLTIKIAVMGLDAGDAVVIQIDDSVNAFTDFVTHASFTIEGPIGATSNTGDTDGLEGEATGFHTNPKYFSVAWYDVPAIRWGTESAVIRVNVSSFTGSTKHLTYNAWIEVSSL